MRGASRAVIHRGRGDFSRSLGKADVVCVANSCWRRQVLADAHVKLVTSWAHTHVTTGAALLKLRAEAWGSLNTVTNKPSELPPMRMCGMLLHRQYNKN